MQHHTSPAACAYDTPKGVLQDERESKRSYPPQLHRQPLPVQGSIAAFGRLNRGPGASVQKRIAHASFKRRTPLICHCIALRNFTR